MKKLVLLFVLFPAFAFAGELFSANKAVLIWNPVIKYDDGLTIPENVLPQITYTIYQADLTTDPEHKNARPIVSVLKGTEYLISLDAEGTPYTYGVQAVRSVGGKIVSTGKIAWMQDFPDTYDGIIYYKAPGATEKIGVK